MAPSPVNRGTLADRVRVCCTGRGFVSSAFIALLAFSGSMVANFYAGLYATARATNPVPDIVLSNVRPLDLAEAYVYGTYALIALIALVLARRPQRIPFALYSLALLYYVRAFFVPLTHLGSVPVQQAQDFGELVNALFFGGDRFFSGHTGAPFLMALVMWRERWLRVVFLTVSVLFGAVVLLAHLHYTIDVFAAFFIAYGVFRLAERLFGPDERTLQPLSGAIPASERSVVSHLTASSSFPKAAESRVHVK